MALPSRPIHVTTDISSSHLLVAYNDPSGLTVHRLEPDATIGRRLEQARSLEFGVYGHQVRVAPSNRLVLFVARGNDAAGSRPEDPGAIKVFSYREGVLGGEASVAPNGGYGFGPRHLDFHPSQPWIYVSLERQNQLRVYRYGADAVASEALFVRDTLSAPRTPGVRQIAGTVHVHPNGRFVYVANRANPASETNGRRILAGGENTLAVYAIDQRTGEPRLIQHINTHGVHARTFHIDPSGRMLVAAHIEPVLVDSGGSIQTVPARLSVFRIGTDGQLVFVRAYDVDVDGSSMFWMGMVPLS